MAIDGREYAKLTNNPEIIPNIKLSYEWNTQLFHKEMEDQDSYAKYDNEIDSEAGGKTFDISATQKELQLYLRELVENLQRVSSETSEENKKNMDRLEKELIQLMNVIDLEREDTLTKSNETYKLLEEAKTFINAEKNKLQEEANG